jgi:hypothetical protein
LINGCAAGAEAEFGACAERCGVEEVNFTFDGHHEVRRRGVRVPNHEELQAGDVNLEYVSRLMNGDTLKRDDPKGAFIPTSQALGRATSSRMADGRSNSSTLVPSPN